MTSVFWVFLSNFTFFSTFLVDLSFLSNFLSTFLRLLVTQSLYSFKCIVHGIVIPEAIFLPSCIAPQPERWDELFFSGMSSIGPSLASQTLTIIDLTKWIYGGLWMYEISLDCTLHYELRVSWFQLPLKWASWGGTKATALASCFHFP